MKGYISICIPVKPYIKAYMIKELGEVMILSSSRHIIYNKIYDLLERPQNSDKFDATCNYSEKIILLISISNFKKKGCNLNHTNVRSFNKFVELLVKHRFHNLMDDLVINNPGFKKNLDIVRKRMGIDIDAWDDDSMKKDYYRSRIKRNMPLLKFCK